MPLGKSRLTIEYKGNIYYSIMEQGNSYDDGKWKSWKLSEKLSL